MTYTIVNLATPEEMSRSWCVYTLLDKETAKTVYVGHCRLSQVFGMPDARLRPDFDGTRPVILRVDIITPHRTAAQIAAQGIINKMGTPPINRRQPFTRIKCVDTGEIWKSANACAAAHELAQPALSNHLNNMPGYRSVKGRQYERVL